MALSPKVGEKLAAMLRKKYAPSSSVDAVFKGNDLTFLTSEAGDPMVLFIGQRRPDGSIKGDRFARKLLKDAEGKSLKDHWDYKGRV